MRDVHIHSLDADAPRVGSMPETVTIPLHAHQAAVLQRMEEHEQQALTGIDCSGSRLFSNYGILGDSVGAGKSLMVLGHIARLPQLPPLKRCTQIAHGHTKQTFSLTEVEFKDCSEAGSLIIVPHSLFRQWAGYMKGQTTLRALFLDKVGAFASPTFTQDVLAADVVLVSNTMYKHIWGWCYKNTIQWKRIFLDEADSICIAGTNGMPTARFTWYITASWMNLVFPSQYCSMSTALVETLITPPSSRYHCLAAQISATFNLSARSTYGYMQFEVTSHNFLNKLIDCVNPSRGRLVVRCTPTFIEESIHLPPLYKRTILCKQPITQQIVSSFVSGEVAELLHAGDISGALLKLGVQSKTKVTLVEALTANLKKELARLESTYTFKSGLEYSTPAAKEAALETLRAKIKQAKESIQAVEERVAAADEMCPICYDELDKPLMTPCCSRSFCPSCILRCLTKQANCPMCRAALKAASLIQVVAADETNQIVTAGAGAGAAEPALGVMPKKHDALLQLLTQHPDGRFLIFSRYDNPFAEIETRVAEMGVRVKQLKGTKDMITSSLRAFEAGDLRCLLLNSKYAGAGLNITAATHVILFHAMTHEEEKQIIGRAHRLGRKEPLQVIKLLHESEEAHGN
jgi:hypothetical protein